MNDQQVKVAAQAIAKTWYAEEKAGPKPPPGRGHALRKMLQQMRAKKSK